MVEEQGRKTVKGKKQGGWWWWWGGRCGGTNAKLAGRRMGRKDVNERKTKSLLLSPLAGSHHKAWNKWSVLRLLLPPAICYWQEEVGLLAGGEGASETVILPAAPRTPPLPLLTSLVPGWNFSLLSDPLWPACSDTCSGRIKRVGGGG